MSRHGSILVLALALLTACDNSDYVRYGTTDNKLRQDLFMKCLKAVPVGPLATKYNDWSEVVSECGAQAKDMTWGCIRNCR